jgi:hypothetical protein
LFVYQVRPCVILNNQMDQCLLFIPTHMGEPLMNTKKGYKATYTYPCGLRSKNKMYKTLHKTVVMQLGFPCSLLLHACSPGHVPRLVWHANALLRGEERLVARGVKSKASVLGRFSREHRDHVAPRFLWA